MIRKTKRKETSSGPESRKVSGSHEKKYRVILERIVRQEKRRVTQEGRP